MNDGVTTWLIIGLFFAPLHFFVPVLVAALRADGDDTRRLAIQRTALECALSMAIGFSLAVWLAPVRLNIAMVILVVTMVVPYLGILMARPGLRAKSK